MAKPSPKVKKAFAIAILAGAFIKSSNSGSFKLNALANQAAEKRDIFQRNNPLLFHVLNDRIKAIWVELGETHDISLTLGETEVFTEMVLNLLPKADMKAFLKINFSTKEKVRDSRKSTLLALMLDLDAKLNALFKLNPTATRESLGRVLVKPVAPKKVKNTTPRDKAKPARMKKFRRRLAWQQKQEKRIET